MSFAEAAKSNGKTLHFKPDLDRFVSGCVPGYFWSNFTSPQDRPRGAQACATQKSSNLIRHRPSTHVNTHRIRFRVVQICPKCSKQGRSDANMHQNACLMSSQIEQTGRE